MKKLSLQGWRSRPKNTLSVFPSVYTVAYATGRACLKQYGSKLKSLVYVIGEDYINVLMEASADSRRFDDLLVKKFKKQPSYLDGLIEWSEKNINLLYDFVLKQFVIEPISCLPNKEIARRYSEYAKKYLAYNFKNTPAWWIGALAAETELKKYLVANYPTQDIEDILATIIDPLEYYNENFNEELSLLDIAIKLKSHRSFRNLLPDTLPLDIRKALAKHVRTYSSIPFGYKTGRIWKIGDFWKRIKRLAQGNPLEIRRHKFKEKRLKIGARDKLTRGLNLPVDYRNLVFALRKLSYLQELKKIIQTRSHPILQLVVFQEIAKRLNIEVKYIEYLTEFEINSLLGSSHVSAKFKNDLVKRASSSVLIIKNGRYSWLTGQKAREFIKVNKVIADVKGVREIRGQSASKGQAKGRVKVCLLSTEISKVKNGDILVTAMTTPDFVPAMRKAAAIITDEGGITSHATIVARELNKPCIIGTKIATQVLKDGDMVDMNANQGIIKILNR